MTLFLLSCNGVKETQNIPDGYELIWADEFDYNGALDAAKWGFERGLIRNVESQYYTDSLSNARVENGYLIIEARKERIANEKFVSDSSKDWREKWEYAEYTSASVSTKGIAEWQYGWIEVKAKLPAGTGMWPAIWMMGTNQFEARWPLCGEIDIMEHVGFEPDSIFGTIHTKAFNHMIGTQMGKKIFIDDPYQKFHVYALEWTPDKIDFLLDGNVFYSILNKYETVDEWPFNQPFFLKMNIAVGGQLGGRKGIDDSVFPQQMVVDYVRVYQIKE